VHSEQEPAQFNRPGNASGGPDPCQSRVCRDPETSPLWPLPERERGLARDRDGVLVRGHCRGVIGAFARRAFPDITDGDRGRDSGDVDRAHDAVGKPPRFAGAAKVLARTNDFCFATNITAAPSARSRI
jgi:hypothetical protein